MTAWDEWEPYAAVLLAGGRSSRLDGIDKSGIELGGRTMLAWARDEGFGVARYRALTSNVASLRVAEKLGFTPFGGNVAVRLPR